MFSVALVDVLDDALALIAAGEIDIDVGPFAALFGEEAFEEEVHLDGVDGGDAEGVADGGVGGGTASLAQDALFAGETDEVPDDEEVAAEAEFFDEREFLFDLLAGAVVIGLIAAAGSFVREPGEEGGDGFVGRQRVFGELVAEVGEGEVEAVGDGAGVGDGFGEVGEELRHFGGGFEMALGVAREQAAGFGERGLVFEAGEDVEDFAARFGGVGDAVGGDERKVERAGEIDGGLVAGFFGAIVMALEFDVYVFVAEDSG